MTWLGPNIPQPPKWDARLWADVAEWTVDGAHAVASGTAAASAYQYGRDPDTPGDTRPGPWQSMHRTKIYLSHNQLGLTTTPFRFFKWTWQRSSIDGREIGAEVVLSFGDAHSGLAADPETGTPAEPAGLPRLYWGGGDNGYGSDDVVLNADTDYILEIDCMGQVNARFYEQGDDPPDWPYGRPFYTGHGAPRSFLRMEHVGATPDILLLDQIDVAMPMTLGAAFGHIVIGYGDEVTDTFWGLPTLTNTVEWYVDGHRVKPLSYDEVTGRVTFDRPPQFQSIITQVGQFRGE